MIKLFQWYHYIVNFSLFFTTKLGKGYPNKDPLAYLPHGGRKWRGTVSVVPSPGHGQPGPRPGSRSGPRIPGLGLKMLARQLVMCRPKCAFNEEARPTGRQAFRAFSRIGPGSGLIFQRRAFPGPGWHMEILALLIDYIYIHHISTLSSLVQKLWPQWEWKGRD
jgi:hypothetical protein